MNRLAIVGGLVVIGLAVGVYRAKLGAEETEARNDKLRAEISEVHQDISVLRAEEAYLSRPERIGPIARERLGLEPALPSQFAVSETLRDRIGEERVLAPEAQLMEPASATPDAPPQEAVPE